MPSHVKMEIDYSDTRQDCNVRKQEQADALLAQPLARLRRHLELERAGRRGQEIRWEEASRRVRPERVRDGDFDVLAESLESTLLLRWKGDRTKKFRNSTSMWLRESKQESRSSE